MNGKSAGVGVGKLRSFVIPLRAANNEVLLNTNPYYK